MIGVLGVGIDAELHQQSQIMQTFALFLLMILSHYLFVKHFLNSLKRAHLTVQEQGLKYFMSQLCGFFGGGTRKLPCMVNGRSSLMALCLVVIT